MFALITTLSTNVLRTYIIYRFMRLFFWTDIEEKKKEVVGNNEETENQEEKREERAFVDFIVTGEEKAGRIRG